LCNTSPPLALSLSFLHVCCCEADEKVFKERNGMNEQKSFKINFSSSKSDGGEGRRKQKRERGGWEVECVYGFVLVGSLVID
jgi:hypothetical protein